MSPKTLELKFVSVRQMHITGWQDNYMNDILKQKLLSMMNYLQIKQKD